MLVLPKQKINEGRKRVNRFYFNDVSVISEDDLFRGVFRELSSSSEGAFLQK